MNSRRRPLSAGGDKDARAIRLRDSEVVLIDTRECDETTPGVFEDDAGELYEVISYLDQAPADVSS